MRKREISLDKFFSAPTAFTPEPVRRKLTAMKQMFMYTIARGETVLGEFTTQELRDHFHAGRFLPTDLLYQTGFRDWIILQDALILISETPPTSNSQISATDISTAGVEPDNAPPVISLGFDSSGDLIAATESSESSPTKTGSTNEDYYFETIEISATKDLLSLSSDEDQLHFIRKSGNTLTVQLRDGTIESFSTGNYETFSEKNGYGVRSCIVRDKSNPKRKIKFTEVIFAASIEWPESGWEQMGKTAEAEAWWEEIYKRVGFEETKLSKASGFLSNFV